MDGSVMTRHCTYGEGLEQAVFLLFFTYEQATKRKPLSKI